MNTNKPSDSLIFLLIDDTTSAPDFKTQEEIEEYFGESVSFTLDEYNYSEDYFWKYLEKWESIHKFKIIQGDEVWFDRYTGSVEIEVVYSLEDKYYSIIYRSNLYEEDELISESVEVKPIQETVTKFVKI